MDRATFATQLADAARRAVEFAREFVEEHLPDAVRFRVELNSSYDGNPLHADERVYPDDRRVHLTEHIARLELEGMVELLWRDGAIPEWINLSVESADEEATLIQVESCGRFTANDALLYYEHEGRTPFHVLGPSLPPDTMRDHPERFSLWWSTQANQSATLQRALDHADKVRILTIKGPWCDDHVLASLQAFTRLVTLKLEDTPIGGRGFADLGDHVPIKYLSFAGVGPQQLDLGAISRLAQLTHLSVEGSPAAIAGLDSLTNLEHLQSVRLPVAALRDLLFAAGAARLDTLELDGSQITSLGPLERAPHLQHLSLQGTPISDLALKHLAGLPRLRTLTLSQTPITDAGVRHLASIPTLWRLWLVNTAITDVSLDALSKLAILNRLDVRGTRVTTDGLAALARKLPGLRIVADGWQHPPRRPGV